VADVVLDGPLAEQPDPSGIGEYVPEDVLGHAGRITT
jgi:hypothetical protein